MNALDALDALDNALGRTPGRIRARREVIERFARKRRNGKVVLCEPTAQERASPDPARSLLKVIYDTRAEAEAAAAELARLGARAMEPYPCHRSRHGHLHLRTKK